MFFDTNFNFGEVSFIIFKILDPSFAYASILCQTSGQDILCPVFLQMFYCFSSSLYVYYLFQVNFQVFCVGGGLSSFYCFVC